MWDLTAVLSRVLGRSWSEAGSLAARIEDSEVLAVALSSDDLGRMAAEVGNADDGVARWCSAVVIGACGAPSGSIRLSLQHALRTERSREKPPDPRYGSQRRRTTRKLTDQNQEGLP